MNEKGAERLECEKVMNARGFLETLSDGLVGTKQTLNHKNRFDLA